jgi:hypothetical protein
MFIGVYTTTVYMLIIYITDATKTSLSHLLSPLYNMFLFLIIYYQVKSIFTFYNHLIVQVNLIYQIHVCCFASAQFNSILNSRMCIIYPVIFIMLYLISIKLLIIFIMLYLISIDFLYRFALLFYIGENVGSLYIHQRKIKNYGLDVIGVLIIMCLILIFPLSYSIIIFISLFSLFSLFLFYYNFYPFTLSLYFLLSMSILITILNNIFNILSYYNIYNLIILILYNLTLLYLITSYNIL